MPRFDRLLRGPLVGLLVLVVASCSAAGSSTPSAGAATNPTGGGSATLGATAAPTATPTPEPVRLALDWTPNTDHTGFYVAQAKGWYAAAGVELQVLPYNNTAPETLMGAGQADCGISFQDALTFAVAAGIPITSVMAILQHTASAIGVLASSDITRPRQLDGKVYAGFGYPNEVPTLKFVIQADGGKGDFKVVTADSTAYEALYSKQADFTIPFTAWEGVEATERGIALRYFRFQDYGFPDFYQVVLACSNPWLAAHPDLAKRFVSATVQGFEYAVTNPADAAAILIAQNPGVFDANPKLPVDSANFLASGGYYVDANGNVGTQTLQEWTGYSKFLFDQHLLTDAAGKVVTTEPDYASLFSDSYLP
ncbi:MAG TPA: ABC transporter substrate-binding protein [Candidatus Limnocylindrales bacterium]|nr:ABC transporter substrate-binding protein [Candidatus Limnocylindrales bacterium]